MKRKHVIWIAVAMLFVLVGCGSSSRSASQGDRGTDRDYDPAELVVSRETTYLTEPLNSDGTVNYHQYIEDQLSDGVTPDTNGGIGVLQVMGPEVFYGRDDLDMVLPLVAEKLGVSVETLQAGPRLIAFERYCFERELETSPAFESDDRIDWDLVRCEVDTRPWSAEEYPIPAQWVEQASPAMDVLVESLEKPDFYLPAISLSDPPTPVGEGIRGNRFGSVMGTFRQILIRAMQRTGTGDLEGAWNDIYAVRLAARRVGDHTLLHCLMGVSLEASALEAQRTLLAEGRPDSDLLEQMVPDVAELEPLSILPGFEGERVFGLIYIQAAHAGQISPDQQIMWQIMTQGWDGEPINVNHYMRRHNEKCDKLARIATRESVHGMLDQWEIEFAGIEPKKFKFPSAVWGEVPSEKVRVFTWASGREAEASTDALCDHQLATEKETTKTMIENCGKVYARADALEASVALERYRLAHGEYPKTLDALVPEYLDEVPADPFDGERMRYLLTDEEAVVYSVGANLTDDGGVSKKYSGGLRECQTCDDDCVHDDVCVVLQRKD